MSDAHNGTYKVHVAEKGCGWTLVNSPRDCSVSFRLAGQTCHM